VSLVYQRGGMLTGDYRYAREAAQAVGGAQARRKQESTVAGCHINKSLMHSPLTEFLIVFLIIPLHQPEAVCHGQDAPAVQSIDRV
jgi:hypothetical protein